ncbi:MAG TPA: hypothetical protein VJ964_04585 [Balneolaceae bacterium]|nr:hypothetical protein [Balneolaceae bacterium]
MKRYSNSDSDSWQRELDYWELRPTTSLQAQAQKQESDPVNRFLNKDKNEIKHKDKNGIKHIDKKKEELAELYDIRASIAEQSFRLIKNYYGEIRNEGE